MKRHSNIILLTLVACTTLFSGCKHDAEPIVGSWTLDLAESYYTYTVMRNTKSTDAITGATYEDEDGNTVEFREMADLNITSCTLTFSDDGTVAGEYVRNGETISGSVKYSVAENELTMDGKAWTIEQLDDSRLVIDRQNDAAPEKATNKERRHLIFNRK